MGQILGRHRSGIVDGPNKEEVSVPLLVNKRHSIFDEEFG